MKKKIIRVALVAAIAVAAGWSYNQSQNEMAMSDLALANVEALARGESATDSCDDWTTSTCVSNGVSYYNMYRW